MLLLNAGSGDEFSVRNKAPKFSTLCKLGHTLKYPQAFVASTGEVQ